MLGKLFGEAKIGLIKTIASEAVSELLGRVDNKEAERKDREEVKKLMEAIISCHNLLHYEPLNYKSFTPLLRFINPKFLSRRNNNVSDLVGKLKLFINELDLYYPNNDDLKKIAEDVLASLQNYQHMNYRGNQKPSHTSLAIIKARSRI